MAENNGIPMATVGTVNLDNFECGICGADHNQLIRCTPEQMRSHMGFRNTKTGDLLKPAGFCGGCSTPILKVYIEE